MSEEKNSDPKKSASNPLLVTIMGVIVTLIIVQTFLGTKVAANKCESGVVMNELDFKEVNIEKIEDLCTLLSDFQIDLNGSKKGIDALYEEVKKGDCILGIENGNLLRRVEGVKIKCFYTNSEGERFKLVEEKQIFKNGDIHKRGYDFVAEKLQFDESPEDGALRGLFEELQIPKEHVRLSSLFEENRCDTVEAPDYKGVQTRYNTHVFACDIPEACYKTSYVEEQEEKKIFFSWSKI